MEQSVSTCKMAFQPNVFKTEKYTMEITIPHNFRIIQPGESSTFQFPEYKFTSGLLSKTTCPYTVKGSFTRETCRIEGLEFLLPEQIESQTLLMKPFDVELFAKKSLIKKLENVLLPAASLIKQANSTQPPNYNKYCVILDLAPSWTDNVDMIRITWEILIREISAGFVLVGSIKNHKKDEPIMSEKIASFYNSKDFSDATLLCDDQVFHVHRFVLSCVSPVFENMFLTDMKEKQDGKVVIKNIQANILELMIKWIYTKDIKVYELDNADAFELFKATHFYQVKHLKEIVANELFLSISIENALIMYSFGETYAENEIMHKALQIIKTNKDTVFEDEDIFKEFLFKFPKLMMELVKK